MDLTLSRRKLLWGATALASFSRPAAAEAIDFTPGDEVFARDHFSEPRLSLANWRLRIEGAVSRPMTLSFADLLEMPLTRQDALLECAGNSEHGTGVAMGDWEGVRLRDLLKMAGAEPVGVADRGGYVLLEGADQGKLLTNFASAPYTRIVPFSKCWAPESLLAIKVGGRFLQKRNGFPARIVLPGWYGMDSVKWVQRIQVLGPKDRLTNHYAETGMSRLYSRLGVARDPVPLSSVLVKSVISYPGKDAKLVRGRIQLLGYAWTGDGVVTDVKVSIDGGRTWQAATLKSQPRRFAWVRWTYDWDAAPGEHTLLCRAADSEGNRQPLSRDPQRRDGYELNWTAPIRCVVA